MRSASRPGSAKMAARLRGRPLAAVVPIGIGHNNGPPMATRWGLHCWRRAQAKVWQTPSPEVVKLRLRRAAELGLTYRQLALILMDVGRTPTAITLAVSGTLVHSVQDSAAEIRLLPTVADRLAALIKPKVFIVAGGERAEVVDAIIAATGARIDGECNAADHESRVAALVALLAAHGVSPRSTIMIGASDADRACADRASCAAYLPASAYFSNRP